MTQRQLVTLGLVGALQAAMLASPALAAPQAPAAAAGQTASAPGVTQAPARGGAQARVPFVPDAPLLPLVRVDNALPLPDGAAYSAVASVAINSQGHIFVLHRAPAPVVEFDAAGKYLRAFGEGVASRAHSIRIDSADNMWVVDAGDHTATKLSPRGDVLMTLGTKGVAGNGDADAANGKFNLPSDIAIAPSGDLFITQGEGGGPDPRVIRFTSAGKFVKSWSLAYPDGRRSNPHAVEVDRNGSIYVADRDVMRIRIFQPDATPVRDIQMQNQVCGIFLDRTGGIWIATGIDGQFMHVDPSGKVLGYLGRRGTGPGEFSEAHMLAVAPGGDVFVTDTMARKIERFSRIVK